jgi:hypothetical protein
MEYSASETGGDFFAQAAKQDPKTTAAIALTQGVQLDFTRATPFIICP